MEKQVVDVESAAADWQVDSPRDEWISALEAGKVLHFSSLEFALSPGELRFFTSQIRNPKTRNISLDAQGRLKGALGDAGLQAGLGEMIGRFRKRARSLVNSCFPRYKDHLRIAPTSFRPIQVETRKQSWRADDRRLHVDAFPSRPNYGERILRVFINVSPDKVPRVWRIGEPFEAIAARFLAQITPYAHWRAKALDILGITKSLRSEYDHLMLGLHDAMKSDLDYQCNSPQITMPFQAGAVWVCFSDQTSHAAMSGQFMMEQTFHLPASEQYQPEASPLAILSRLTGRELSNASR